MPFMSRASIEALAESHTELAHQMEKVALVLAVSDPKASVSAESYEGLRKTVMAASSERRAHVAQLAQLCDALDRGVSAADLRTLLSEWCEHVGLIATSDTRDPALYQVIAGDGDVLEVVSPAWIDTTTRALVRQGQARLVTVAPEAANDSATVPTGPESAPPVEDTEASAGDGGEAMTVAVPEAPHPEGDET